MTKATKAIRFKCVECEHDQYIDDTLTSDFYNDKLVRSDVVECKNCGKGQLVIIDCLD